MYYASLRMQTILLMFVLPCFKLLRFTSVDCHFQDDVPTTVNHTKLGLQAQLLAYFKQQGWLEDKTKVYNYLHHSYVGVPTIYIDRQVFFARLSNPLTFFYRKARRVTHMRLPRLGHRDGTSWVARVVRRCSTQARWILSEVHKSYTTLDSCGLTIKSCVLAERGRTHTWLCTQQPVQYSEWSCTWGNSSSVLYR